MNCDFCYAENPKYWNKVSPTLGLVVSKDDSLSKMTLHVTFDEDWAACAVCQRLINEGDRKALTQRALDNEKIGLDHPAAAYIKRLHELFLQHRINIPPVTKGGENYG